MCVCVMQGALLDTHTHTHVRTLAYTHTHTHTHTHTRMHACIRIHRDTYLHTEYIHLLIHSYISLHIFRMCVCHLACHPCHARALASIQYIDPTVLLHRTDAIAQRNRTQDAYTQTRARARTHTHAHTRTHTHTHRQGHDATRRGLGFRA